MISLCLWAVPVGYLLYSLMIVLFVINRSYQAILQFYSHTWPNAFDVDTISRDCFTENWFLWIKSNSTWIIGLIVVVLVIYLWYSRATYRFVSGLLNETAKLFRFLFKSFAECRPGEKVWLLLLASAILGYWIYLFMGIPFMSDEACAYLYFAKQGFFLTVTSYPIPNNHIFLDVLCSWLAKIPFLSPELIMRIPSLLAGTIMYYGIFCVFKYWGGFRRAMVVVAGVAFCHILSYYAMQGRGYQLQLLCTVVSAVSAWAYWFSREWEGRFGYALFVVSSVLGFYVNPLFAMHFLALILTAAFLFAREKKYAAGFVFLRAIFLVMVLVLVLYLPLIMGSSLRSILDNKYVGSGSWYRLAHEFGSLVYDIKYDFYLGFAAVFLVPAAIIFCLFLYYRKTIGGYFYRWALYYFVASVLSVAIITLYERIYPLERSLTFWVLAMNIFFMNIVYDTLTRYFRRKAMTFVLVFLLIKVTLSVRLLYWDRFLLRNDILVNIHEDMEKDFGRLSSLGAATWQITDSEDYYPIGLRLYLEKHGEKGSVLFSDREAVGEVIFLRDVYDRSIPIQGYHVWADQRRTGWDSSHLTIYVSRALWLKH